MRFLSTKYDKTILFVSLKSAAMWKGSVAVLWNNHVFRVDLPESAEVKELKEVVRKITRTLKPHCVFLDGYFEGLGEYGIVLRDRYQLQPANTKVEFLAATTSVMMVGSVFKPLMESKFVSQPWELIDYLNAVDAGIEFTAQQRKNIGYDGEDIRTALRMKFLIAGYSCRFMLDYTAKQVITTLKMACDRVKNRMIRGESSQQTINTLVVTIQGKMIPVSVVAALLIGHYHLLPDQHAGDFSNMVDAVKCRQRALLGWYFEQEVVDRLTAWLRPTAGATYVAVDLSAQFVATLELEPVLQTPALPFQLEICDGPTAVPFPLPGDCVEFRFHDWKEVVGELCRRNEQKNYRPVVLIPLYYANPFFDFALAAWGHGPGALVWISLRTFQATVSTTHSCDATIVQAICDGLAKQMIGMSKVIHHAVVPSKVAAASFRFDAGVAMQRCNRVTRSDTSGKRSRSDVDRAMSSWGETAAFDFDLGEDSGVCDFNPGGLWSILAKKRTWVQVEVGETLVLANAFTALALGQT